MLNHSGSVLQVPTVFIISFLILSFLIPVQAVPPTQYYEIDSDVELRGAIFVDVDPSSFYGSLINGVIQIDSSVHFENVTVRFKGIALDSRLKKYNGFNVGYTHIADNGTRKYELKPLEIDFQGFAYLTTDFSTVIINGMTGTTTTTLNGLSGNQSISVPAGSSYDLNITNNQPSVWAINGTGFSKRIQWTLNTTSENLTDVQVKRVTPYDSDMQPDMDDRQLTYCENDTLISFWDEVVINSTNATGYVKVPKTSTTEQQQYWHYYSNSTASSASDGDNTFVFFDGFIGSDLDLSKWDVRAGTPVVSNGELSITGTASEKITSDNMFGVDTILTVKMKEVSQVNYGGSGFTKQTSVGLATNDISVIYQYSSTGYADNRIGGVLDYSTFTWTDTIYHTFDIIRNGASSTIYKMDGSTVSTRTTQVPSGDMYITAAMEATATANQVYDYIYLKKYISDAPTWLADGEEQTASGVVNITASITGDNNTQSYNTSQSREFTLTPTGSTNNVLINTTSTDYDITVTTYWTDDTTQYSQTSDSGYVKSYINYTPSFTITTAIFNDTINLGIHNFSNDDYVGNINTTINGSYISAIRNGQEINATAYDLIDGIYYWINSTIPYNNIPTVGTISDISAYLGIPYVFSAPSFSDPEELVIDSELWKFGDGDTSNSSNPSHIYTSVGDFNANYSVTETATVSPQTILREFNVSIEVQPVQNLTSTPATDHIHFDWDDYSSADYWNVSKLVTSIPYTPLNVVLDGVADACFDTCAYGFVGDSPNPSTDYGKELIYILRNETYLMLYADGEDNDGFTQDDNFLIGIDASNNNLSTDDRKFILGEGGTVTAKQMTAIDTWIPVATNAQGVVVGAGTPGAIQYEMFIPISELDTNFTNGSTIKFFMSRTHTASNPDIESYYPQTLINTTDATLWQSVNLTPEQEYEYIDNTSVSYFNATGLDIFTWYKYQFIVISGTDESTAVTSFDITLDAPSYSISGFILDILGNPIVAADVWGENGYPLKHDVSNESGYYIGPHFHNGTYTIYANATGYLQNNSGVVTVAGANLTNINITLIADEIITVSKYQKIGEMFIAIPTILKLVFQKIADVIPIIVVLVFIMLIINVIGAAIYAIRVWR